MSSILIYGFGSYGKVRNNPSSSLIERLRKSVPEQAAVFHTFAVSYQEVEQGIARLFEEYDIISAIGFGAAPGECAIRLEAFAHNVVDPSLDGSDGVSHLSTQVVDKGSAAYSSAFVVRDIVEELISKGVPAKVSHEAGAYLCNFAYYLTSQRLRTSEVSDMSRSLFVHLPLLPAEAARLSSKPPSMSLDLMEVAARIILQHVEGISS